MKVNIEHGRNKYALEYDRINAMEMSKILAKSADETDPFTQVEIMLNFALNKNHSVLTAEAKKEIINFVVDNYPLIDGDDGEIGLIGALNKMVEEVIPKGFTKKATMKFAIVE